MNQTKVTPRIVGWSGRWALEEIPLSDERAACDMPYEMGHALGLQPYATTVLASFYAEDEGRRFIFRDGQLVDVTGPCGLPENLERAEAWE